MTASGPRPPASRWGRRVGAPLAALERVASVGLLVTIFLAVCLQIVYRYVLRTPLQWTDELARYSLVWLTFIAAAFVMARNRHIAVDVLTKVLPPGILRVFTAGALAVAGLTCGWAALISWGTVERWASRTSTALQIPMSLVMAAPLVGFGLMALHAFVNALRAAREPRDVVERTQHDVPEDQEVLL